MLDVIFSFVISPTFYIYVLYNTACWYTYFIFHIVSAVLHGVYHNQHINIAVVWCFSWNVYKLYCHIDRQFVSSVHSVTPHISFVTLCVLYFHCYHTVQYMTPSLYHHNLYLLYDTIHLLCSLCHTLYISYVKFWNTCYIFSLYMT